MSRQPIPLATALGSIVLLMTIACVPSSGSGGAESGMSPRPIKLVVVGDSISQGRSVQESYRPWLAEELARAKVEVEFVGSQRGAFDGSGRNDGLDHEAYWGWTSDEVLRRWERGLPFEFADLAIIHLGHNDLGQGEAPLTVGQTLGSIVELLRGSLSSVSVILVEPIPSSHPGLENLSELGSVVRELAISLDRPSARVVSVHGGRGFSAARHTWDGVHPNREGAKTMAVNVLPVVLDLAEEIQMRTKTESVRE